MLCVVFGLLVPGRFHPAWLLEAILPGFTWLTVPTFVLGVIETALYGAWAGLLFSALYDYFASRAGTGKRRKHQLCGLLEANGQRRTSVIRRQPEETMAESNGTSGNWFTNQSLV